MWYKYDDPIVEGPHLSQQKQDDDIFLTHFFNFIISEERKHSSNCPCKPA